MDARLAQDRSLAAPDRQREDEGPRAAEEPADGLMQFLARSGGNAALSRWLGRGPLARMTRFGTTDPKDVSTLTGPEVSVLEEELQANPGLIMSSIEQRRLEQRKAGLPPPSSTPAVTPPAATAPAAAPDPLDDVLKGLGLDATGIADVVARLAAVPAAAAVGLVARLGNYLTGAQVRELVAAAPVGELAAVADGPRRGLLDAAGTAVQAAGWAVAETAAVLAAAVRLVGKELGAARIMRLGPDRGKAITAAAAKKCFEALAAKPAEPAQVAAVAASFIEAGHAQPGALVNSLDPPLHQLVELDVAAGAVGNPAACRFRLVIPEGKIKHIQQGHTYERFFFQSGPGGNNNRNKTGSSMFAPGTDVIAQATAAVTTLGAKAEMWNSIAVTAYQEQLDTFKADTKAWTAATSGMTGKKPPAPKKPANPFAPAAPPGTSIGVPDFIISFTHEDTIPANGPDPETYVFNVSQLVPGASWMTEQMTPPVADAVGFLFGHP